MNGVMKAVGALFVLAIGAGIAWVQLARPAEWEVTVNGTVLTEDGATGRFGVIVVFILIGVVVAFLWGFVAGLRLRHHGLSLVPIFALAAFAAGVFVWRIGGSFGPPDPASVDGAIGDRIPQQLTIDTFSPFLVWPIFALIGLLLAMYSTGDGRAHRAGHRDEVSGS